MAVKLKRLVSEAGAGEDKSFASDDSHPDRFTLLKALSASLSLSGAQASPSAAVLASLVTDEDMVLSALSLKMGTTGTGGATDVEVNVDTVQVATVNVDNTDADGTVRKATLASPVEIPAGSLVELEVATIPTAGANLAATARLSGVEVEA